MFNQTVTFHTNRRELKMPKSDSEDFSLIIQASHLKRAREKLTSLSSVWNELEKVAILLPSIGSFLPEFEVKTMVEISFFIFAAFVWVIMANRKYLHLQHILECLPDPVDSVSLYADNEACRIQQIQDSAKTLKEDKGGISI